VRKSCHGRGRAGDDQVVEEGERGEVVGI
jgi:hypothetical protein